MSDDVKTGIRPHDALTELEEALVIYEASGRGAGRLIRLLRAEVERLRAAVNTYVGAIDDRDRYREALEDVLYLIEDSNGVPRGDNAVEIRGLVVAALDGDDAPDVDECPVCGERGRYESRVRIDGRGFYACSQGHRWQDSTEAPKTCGITPVYRDALDREDSRE